MIRLKIDGLEVRAEEGTTLLTAARGAGIEVPTLCHHEALADWGGCRLCMVEVGHPSWNGWTGLVTACLYEVSEGLVVSTRAEKVMEARRTVLDLLLARCPDAVEIRRMAAEHGVGATSYVESDLDTKCIMCTLCVRVCKAVGAEAIGTAGRGQPKRIAPPFDLPAEACVGCFSCVRICPTDAIEYSEAGAKREIWGRTFEMLPCEGCGKPLISAEERALLAERSGLSEDYFTKCPACKRQETAETIAATFTVGD